MIQLKASKDPSKLSSPSKNVIDAERMVTHIDLPEELNDNTNESPVELENNDISLLNDSSDNFYDESIQTNESIEDNDEMNASFGNYVDSPETDFNEEIEGDNRNMNESPVPLNESDEQITENDNSSDNNNDSQVSPLFDSTDHTLRDSVNELDIDSHSINASQTPSPLKETNDNSKEGTDSSQGFRRDYQNNDYQNSNRNESHNFFIGIQCNFYLTNNHNKTINTTNNTTNNNNKTFNNY